MEILRKPLALLLLSFALGANPAAPVPRFDTAGSGSITSPCGSGVIKFIARSADCTPVAGVRVRLLVGGRAVVRATDRFGGCTFHGVPAHAPITMSASLNGKSVYEDHAGRTLRQDEILRIHVHGD